MTPHFPLWSRHSPSWSYFCPLVYLSAPLWTSGIVLPVMAWWNYTLVSLLLISAWAPHHQSWLGPWWRNIVPECVSFSLVLDLLPFVFSSMALRLYWYIMFFSMLYPCDLMKYLVHRICGIASSAPIRSSSVELFVFSFWFLDILIFNPRPMEMAAPVCLRISSCAK